MTYQMRWLVERRVVLTEFGESVTAEDLQNFVTDLKQYLDEGIPLVHHISNSHNLKKIEFSLATLKSIAGAANVIGELGWQIDVNTNRLNKMFAGMGSQFAGVRSRSVNTLDEAIAFIKENDDTLVGATWTTDVDMEVIL